jgi:hypothetical protein
MTLHFAGVLADRTLCGKPKSSVGWTNNLPNSGVDCPECKQLLAYGSGSESKAAAARDAHIKSMTQAEKLLARVAGLLKATPNCGVVVLYFAVQDGQPVWWFVSDTERLEGFKVDAPAVGVADQENVV